MIDYKLGDYYKDDNDRIIRLIKILHYNDKWLSTIYDCLMVREGKYPSINRNTMISYTPSAMKRCKRLSNAEIIAVAL